MNLFLVISLLIVTALMGGWAVVLLHNSEKKKLIKLSLAFSGGFLLAISFIHFLPELYEASEIQIGLFVLFGFLVQLVLEFFSGGIEHGHIHVHKDKKIPYSILIALGVHSFVEGIPLGYQLNGGILSTHHHDHSHHDYSLFLGIVLHQIPVAIALMTLLLSSGILKRTAWLLLIGFVLTTPIGTLIGYYGGSLLPNFDFNLLLAIVVGMLLHISTTIIFETSENHKFNFVKLITIVLGCALAFVIH
jgi:zinc transporter ZupT